jgi:hypothetical protein
VSDNINPTIHRALPPARTTNINTRRLALVLGTQLQPDMVFRGFCNNIILLLSGDTTVIWTRLDGSGRTATTNQTVSGIRQY